MQNRNMDDIKPDLSIVIPTYNEEKNVSPLYQKIRKSVNSLNRIYEIIFIDDGSTDRTFEVIEGIAKVDKKVKIIQFRRNFHKAAVYAAGLEYAKGDIIITMDGDLQDNPAEMDKFLEKLEEGYDYVSGWKYLGKGNPYRAWPSKFFNMVVRIMTKIDLHDFNCPFKGFRNGVVLSEEIYGELYRFLPVLVSAKGYKIAEVKIENLPRIHGKSKFGIERFWRGFFDLLTILFLKKYFKQPLHLFGIIGLATSFTGLFTISMLYFLKIIFGILIQNTPFLFGLSIMAVILGFQFISIGLVSELIINLNKKKNDHYCIKKVIN
ncbi:MAG: glycosyltransferase family 2 protein [Candidatus Hodarchaeota archaeon]